MCKGSFTTTALDFGTYTPGSGNDVQKPSTISVNCTKGTTFDVGLDAGLKASGVANRAMKSGANQLTTSFTLTTPTPLFGVIQSARTLWVARAQGWAFPKCNR